VKLFENLTPDSGEFRVLNKGNENDDHILVERIISNNGSLAKIQELVQNQINIMHAYLVGTGIHSNGVTDNLDIVPVRAIYKISKSAGVIIEDAYFNKSGVRLDSTRQFDKLTILKSIPMNVFELPKGLPYYFPNNAVNNWKILISL